MGLLHKEYLKLLERWAGAAMSDVHKPADRPELVYYGTGTNVWGAQTHQKGFSAFAVLAADPDTDEKAAKATRRELLDTAVGMLRFTLQSHYSGNYHCMDSDTEKWGHHWLSQLGIERMMHGVEAIWEYLTDEDREQFRRMMISECDWILENRQVQADPVSPNVPESNLWNGAILHRAAMMYPDAPNADKYRIHGTHLLLNSISVPSDSSSEIIFDGKPVSEWHAGANFFESYALNHHGYMNIGYMVICLSNIAMLHFSCVSKNQKAPAALYQHMERLWRLVRACIFDDGRLMRIGGDTRVRYCYCQDYLTPVLALMNDALGENLENFEKRWLSIVRREMDYNGDGSFLSKRCELFIERSPLYYARLESDRACTIAMNAYWRRIFCEFDRNTQNGPHIGTGDYTPDPVYKLPLMGWNDEYHGACYVRDKERIASFVWRAAELPQAMCVPTGDSSMAEWRHNMTSFIEGNGFMNSCRVICHNEKTFAGGFVTSGKYEFVTSALLEENDTFNVNVVNHLAYAALPDGHTVVNMQWAAALRRCHLVRVKPFFLNIPNDLFNNFKRDYKTGPDGSLTVDDKLMVIPVWGGVPKVNRSKARQIGLQHISMPKGNLTESLAYADRGFLCCDEICINGTESPVWYDKDETVFDFGAVVVVSENSTALPVPVTELKTCDVQCRAICITGRDGFRYVAAANFSDAEREIKITDSQILRLEANTADVVKI